MINQYFKQAQQEYEHELFNPYDDIENDEYDYEPDYTKAYIEDNMI